MSIDRNRAESFEFIDNTLDATFDEVPEYLFKIWHIPVPLKDYLSESITKTNTNTGYFFTPSGNIAKHTISKSRKNKQ